MHTKDLKPDKRNARRHTDRNVEMIATSLQDAGFGRSILIANDGTILAGNATVEAAGAVGLDDVQIVESDGSKIIAVKRTDLDPDSEIATKLALWDNRTAELAEWDADTLAVLAEEVDLSGLWDDAELHAILEQDRITDPTNDEWLAAFEGGEMAAELDTVTMSFVIPRHEQPLVKETLKRFAANTGEALVAMVRSCQS